MNDKNMQENLSLDDKKLWKAIDEVLFYNWDPIGVNDCPPARDEYYSYIPQIFKLLNLENANENIISEHLNKIIMENMGMPSNVDSCKFVASLLLEWKQLIKDKR